MKSCMYTLEAVQNCVAFLHCQEIDKNYIILIIA